MALYDFSGYRMDDDELEVVQTAVDALCAAGLDPIAANDVWNNGIMMSDTAVGEVCALEGYEGELVSRVLRDTCDIPYHVIRVSRPIDDTYYVLCVPGSNEQTSNFGTEMGGLDGTLSAIEEGSELCAALSYGDEMPLIVQTTLVHVDCSNGYAQLGRA